MGVEIEIEKDLIKFQLDYYLNISFNNNSSNIGKSCKNKIVVQKKKLKKIEQNSFFIIIVVEQENGVEEKKN